MNFFRAFGCIEEAEKAFLHQLKGFLYVIFTSYFLKRCKGGLYKDLFPEEAF
jgi:hypothetical protein